MGEKQSSSNLAPIAEQEEVLLPPKTNQPDENQMPSSSGEAEKQQQRTVPHSKHKGPPRMIRLRRKRREDPFGTLIQSTKKMRLNEAGTAEFNEAFAGENEANVNGISGWKGPNRQQQVADMEGVLFAKAKDELLLYYGGQEEGEDSDADGYDDDSDSNAENHYTNDYPDEEPVKRFGFVDAEGNEYENESTSEDDNFDHYGDEQTKYRYYDDEEDSDANNFMFGVGGKKKESSSSDDEAD